VVQDPEALIVIGIPFVTKLCLGTAITVIVAVCTAGSCSRDSRQRRAPRRRGRVPFLSRRRETADPTRASPPASAGSLAAGRRAARRDAAGSAAHIA
jgi:hypothetical protein